MKPQHTPGSERDGGVLVVPPLPHTPALVGSSLLRLGPKGGGTNGAARRFPAGRKSGERGDAGARDNLNAAPATWLSILGLLRALLAPLQLPRHPRVSQPPGPPSKARKPWARPLGPIPPGWGSGVALARGTPWGTFGEGWRRWRRREGRGLLRLGLGLARRAHPAWPGRRVASRHRGLRPGEADRRRRPSPFPGPRDPSYGSASRPRGFPPSPPQPGGCWPLPLVPFAPLSVPTSSTLLTGSGAGQVYPRCEASC